MERGDKAEDFEVAVCQLDLDDKIQEVSAIISERLNESLIIHLSEIREQVQFSFVLILLNCWGSFPARSE